MELIMPGIGLIFWMTLSFGLVLIILRNFAWKPILATIKERENHIARSLQQSKKIQRELADLDATKEKLLLQARENANELIKQAKLDSEEIIKKAQQQAMKDANQIIEDAKKTILAERKAAEKEIRQQIVMLSVDMAQKVIKKEFQDPQIRSSYIDKLLEDIQLN